MRCRHRREMVVPRRLRAQLWGWRLLGRSQPWQQWRPVTCVPAVARGWGDAGPCFSSDLSPGSNSPLTLFRREGTGPGVGAVVPVPVSLLGTVHGGGEKVPLDGASKVARRCHAGGKSWQRGLLGLPAVWLATNRE